MTNQNIESVLNERRLFPPPESFTKQAHIKTQAEYEALYRESIDSPETFWPRMADQLHWHKKWDQLLDWSNPPFAKWFVGGQLNIAYNCLDRHLAARGNKPAIIFEGEPGDTRTLTYAELHAEVCKFSNVLLSRGVKTGDRVAIYLPMIPEAAVAMLACARIGAVHTVIFGGFSSEALADRINDSKVSCVITADGGFRRGKIVELKKNVDTSLLKTSSVKNVIVVQRTKSPVTMKPGLDHWYHDLMAAPNLPATHEAPPLDSEQMLFILYTSGTTGKPKGVVHTTGGYLLGAYLTSKYIFDLRDSDIYWCTADIGWVTGHSYIVYGPLANGATVLMYEGAPNSPKEDRFWQIIEKYKVTVFYTAPTAIRAFIKWGDQHPKAHDLSSLRLLGTVGEPINPEAWMWYQSLIGGNRCPIVDTWWQTETGAIMCTPFPGITATKPGSCTIPFFGVDPAVVDQKGREVPANVGGLFVIRKPWPSMMRTVYGDPERFVKTYWSEIFAPPTQTQDQSSAIDSKLETDGADMDRQMSILKKEVEVLEAAAETSDTESKRPPISRTYYFTGDGARKDKDGYFWVMGRVDDVVNVAGHRLGTMEVESALVAHEKVAEAAVVGRPDDLKGQALCAFVTVIAGVQADDKLKDELKAWVAKEIGSIAKPDDIRFSEMLPKTRSGKIVRRLLRDIAAGKETIGDTTTLEDYTILAKLRETEE